MNIFAKITVTIGMAIASLFGFHQSAPTQTGPIVGSTIPITTSFYSDSLQSGITPTQTSFTLVRGTDSQGKSLSGTYGFVIDQGSASQEIVYCTTVSGINVSGCARGVDLTLGTTTVLALEQTHNRGASVQITTAPVVNILANIMRGVDSIPQPIYFDPSVSTGAIGAQNNNVASVGYVNTTAATGCGNSSESVNGCAQLATSIQAASSTSIGSTGARLVIPSSLSTSTPGSNATLQSVMSLNDGKISSNWLNGLLEQYTFNGASTTVTQAFQVNGLPLFNSNTVFPSFSATSTTATSTIAGNLQVSNNATTTNLVVSNHCTGCVSGYVTISTSASLQTSNNAVTTATVTCPAGDRVTGGGGSASTVISGGANAYNWQSWIPATTTYTVSVECFTGSACASGTLTATAICINNP